MVRFVNDFLFIFSLCYRRLYIGYRPTLSRRDAAAGVGGNCTWLSGGERIVDKSLPGIDNNVLKHVKHVKHQSGCNGLGITIFTKQHHNKRLQK